MLWFYTLTKNFLAVVFNIIYKIEYYGKENIPKGKKGYILASNHVSNYDPLIISFVIKPWIRYLAKAELLDIKGIRWIFNWLGIIPIVRGSGDTTALESAVDLINTKGYVLGVFPEGTRQPHGCLGKPKSGMAMVAKLAQADILPCSIKYEQPIKFRSRIVVKYGPLITYDTLGIEGDDPRAMRKATKLVWNEISSLSGMVNVNE